MTYRISLRSSSMWEPRHPSLKVVWYIPSVRGAGRAVSSCEPTDMTTLGGSDWSQSRIWRQIHKWVGVYDRIAPATDDFGSSEKTMTKRLRANSRRTPLHPASTTTTLSIRSSPRSLFFGVDVFV